MRLGLITLCNATVNKRSLKLSNRKTAIFEKMKRSVVPSSDFSAESSLFFINSSKNYIEQSLHQTIHSSILRYVIPDQPWARHRRSIFLISVTSPCRLRWDLFIMILAVWNCFYIPFAMAFLTVRQGALFLPVNVLVDLAYICDVVVYARSTYIDLHTGEEVRDGKKIIWKYFQSGKLIVDVLSAIPFGIITWATEDNEQFRLLALVKVFRLLRLSKIIMFMRTKQHFKLKIKLAQLFFVLLTYLHIVACLWFLLLCESNQYIPPALYIDQEADLYDSNGTRQYAYSLYMSVYMLTAAEIGPRTPSERIFAGLIVLSGQLFQAFMFGEIAVVMFNLNGSSKKIATIQEAAATTMVNMHIQVPLHRSVMAYLVSSQASMRKQTEFEGFFVSLSPSLKQEVLSFLFFQAISLNPAASQDTEVADWIITKIKYKYCRPEEKIVVQGEPGKSLYFIASGQCEVWVLDENRQAHKVKRLGLGQHFGEVALLYSRPRSASVIATNHATLARLSERQFKLLLEMYPKGRALFQETATKYNDHYLRFLKKTLRLCPFLRPLKRSALNSMIYRLPVTRYDAGHYLYKEGDSVNNVIFILDGKVEIFVPFNDYRTVTLASNVNWSRELSRRMDFGRESIVNIKQKRDMRFLSKWVFDRLGRGCVIGSNSILLQETVNMYAKTMKPTIVMTLSADLLQVFCTERPELGEAILNYREERQLDHWLIRVKRIQQSALDYEKRFEGKEAERHMKRWKTHMKIKRCAVGKMLEKRNIKQRGFPNMLSLSYKLKALLEAEEKQDIDLVEKIRMETYSIASNFLAPALKLLQTTEVVNPMLVQFSLEAAKCSHSIIYTRAAIRKLRYGLEAVRCSRLEVAVELREMTEWMQLLGMLRNEERSEGRL